MCLDAHDFKNRVIEFNQVGTNRLNTVQICFKIDILWPLQIK